MIEIADDVAPLLVLLLLFVDEVGDGELVEEELLVGSEAVDGFLVTEEEDLREVAVEMVGGMEVLPPRLHSGLPAESRKHMYPGARSGIEQGRSGPREDGRRTAAKVLSSAHNVARSFALRVVGAAGASFAVRAAPALTVDRSAVISSKDGQEAT